ncbi:hypothetical protein DICPUDRAFT_33883 [Dictyostelium purpureum]|uniref:Thioredoxin domain-containing protein n=1 Tax=Dictyostelium purpureum TaxID=5786 RepID=F0ZLN8_DICPU|nr:uncharacterized protein DICPUDRAFT_33883 [Dictyostelium purpureum]EGC35132.1 hypothetical protein DICPUDRAFT_33883 [Dictyostelium purpureum]|eukprot:XP_003288325.1 hypothetical protein DICPUDRAFT_33883 [Dictyostelium purpureum]
MFRNLYLVLLFIIINILSSFAEINLSEYKSTPLDTITLNSFISSSKPAIVYYYTKTADEYLEENNEVAFGVLDIDKELKIRSSYSIETPSVVYYKKGKEVSELQGVKTKKSLEKFIEDPLTVPEPFAGPGSWSDIESQVAHLSNRNYTSFISNNKDVLAMFFTPQCGHCKRAKPAYGEASVSVVKKNVGRLAAVDCSINKKVCDILNIESYPTFIYFKDGKKVDAYKGGRAKDDFINFLSEKSKESPTVKLNKKSKKEL